VVAAEQPLLEASRRFRKHSMQRRLGSGFLVMLTGWDRSNQSANRYASLYFLREIAGIQVFLVNVYFIGDPIRRRPRREKTGRSQSRTSIESFGLSAKCRTVRRSS